MPDAPLLPSRRDRHAPTRALGALAASLLVVNLTLWFWPKVDLGPDLPAQVAPAEQIVMEMIEPTEQPPPPAYIPPLPPPPPTTSEQPPEEVPDERVIEEVLREVDLPTPPAPPRPPTASTPQRTPRVLPPGPPAPPGPPPPSGPPAASDRIVERPDRSPSVRGQAFPVYPASASRSGFRGRARVRVLVNSGGRVTDAEIVSRTVFDRDRETETASFPPEFDAAVLDAARRYVFSPARDDGERVRAYAFVIISLDPPS